MSPIIFAVTTGIFAGVAVAIAWAGLCLVLVPGLAPIHGLLQVPLFAVSAIAVGGYTLLRGLGS